MISQRVICFVDGLNLHLAIKALKAPHLRWVNLSSLASEFLCPKSQRLTDIYYFSAHPTWMPDDKDHHIQFVKASAAYQVIPVMGFFKERDAFCFNCKHKWTKHEEKETDVNLALQMLHLAYQDKYDEALLISNDSDFTPAIRLIRSTFPAKKVTVIAPPKLHQSKSLSLSAFASTAITVKILAKNLLPAVIYDSQGNVVVKRPIEFTPPHEKSKSVKK